jgi:iron complex outermembrane receptor protein
LGVTLARTERAPTEIELFADGAHLATASFEVGDPSLGEEVATSIEAKLRFDGARVRWEANAFHIAFNDFTTFFASGAEDPESGLPIFIAQQEDASFTGTELTLGLVLLRAGALEIRADAQFDAVTTELSSGGPVPRSPPRSFTLGAEFETERLLGRAEWVNTASQTDLAAFETPTEGHDLFNARIAFRPVPGSDRLVIRLDGRNLTDEEQRVHSSFVKDLLPRPGRSIRLALATRF